MNEAPRAFLEGYMNVHHIFREPARVGGGPINRSGYYLGEIQRFKIEKILENCSDYGTVAWDNAKSMHRFNRQSFQMNFGRR